MEGTEENPLSGRLTRARAKRYSVDRDITNAPATPSGKVAAIQESVGQSTPGRRTTRRNSLTAANNVLSQNATPDHNSTTKRGSRLQTVSPEMAVTPKRSSRFRTLSFDSHENLSARRKSVVREPALDALPEGKITDTKTPREKRITRSSSKSPLDILEKKNVNSSHKQSSEKQIKDIKYKNQDTEKAVDSEVEIVTCVSDEENEHPIKIKVKDELASSNNEENEKNSSLSTSIIEILDETLNDDAVGIDLKAVQVKVKKLSRHEESKTVPIHEEPEHQTNVNHSNLQKEEDSTVKDVVNNADMKNEEFPESIQPISECGNDEQQPFLCEEKENLSLVLTVSQESVDFDKSPKKSFENIPHSENETSTKVNGNDLPKIVSVIDLQTNEEMMAAQQNCTPKKGESSTAVADDKSMNVISKVSLNNKEVESEPSTPVKNDSRNGKMVCFDGKIKGENSRSSYPKTPIHTKSKSCIIESDSSEDEMLLSEADNKDNDVNLGNDLDFVKKTPARTFAKIESMESSTPISNTLNIDIKKPIQDLTPVTKCDPFDMEGKESVKKDNEKQLEDFNVPATKAPSVEKTISEVNGAIKSDSWSHGVSGKASTANKLDYIEAKEELMPEAVQILEDNKETRRSLKNLDQQEPASNSDDYESFEDENEFENGDEDEEPYQKHAFVEDEAMEVEDYESGDSMDSEERREIEENEIREEGESLGTEDSNDGDEDDKEDSENDSFIVSDEEKLDIDSDIDNFEDEASDKKGKKFRRIIPNDSSSDESGTKTQRETNNIGNNMPSIIEKESDAMQYSVESVSTDKSSDIHFIPSQSSLDSNTSKLSDSARVLCSDGKDEPTENSIESEDEEQINISRKQALKKLNKSDRFNKTNHELDADPQETSVEVEKDLSESTKKESQEFTRRSSVARQNLDELNAKECNEEVIPLSTLPLQPEQNLQSEHQATEAKLNKSIQKEESSSRRVSLLAKENMNETTSKENCQDENASISSPRKSGRLSQLENDVEDTSLNDNGLLKVSEEDESIPNRAELRKSVRRSSQRIILSETSFVKIEVVEETLSQSKNTSQINIEAKNSFLKDSIADKGNNFYLNKKQARLSSEIEAGNGLNTVAGGSDKADCSDSVAGEIISREKEEEFMLETFKLYVGGEGETDSDGDEEKKAIAEVDEKANEEEILADQEADIGQETDARKQNIITLDNFQQIIEDSENESSNEAKFSPVHECGEEIDQANRELIVEESVDAAMGLESAQTDSMGSNSVSSSPQSIKKFHKTSLHHKTRSDSYLLEENEPVTSEIKHSKSSKHPASFNENKKDKNCYSIYQHRTADELEKMQLDHLRSLFNPLLKTDRQNLVDENTKYDSAEEAQKFVKRLKRQSLGVPSAQDFNPSQSLIIDTQETQKEPEDQNIKRRRLSKSFNGIGSFDSTIEGEDNTHHPHKKSKIVLDKSESSDTESNSSHKNSKGLPSQQFYDPTPCSRRDDFNNNKKPRKIGDKISLKSKAISRDVKKQKEKKKKAKIQTALIMTSPKLLTKAGYTRATKTIKNEDSAASTRPTQKKGSATSSKVTFSPSDQENQQRYWKSSAGVFTETALTPPKIKKPIETFTIATGKVEVFPATPKKTKGGFIEEPVTPPTNRPLSLTRRVQYITSGQQDIPPEVGLGKKKRKRFPTDDEESSPDPQRQQMWSSAGRFIEETLHTRPIARRGGKEILVANVNDFDLISRDKKSHIRNTDVILNQKALLFKYTCAPGSHVQRVNASEVINSKKRRNANNKY